VLSAMRSIIVRASFVTIAGGVGYGNHKYNTDEGFNRSLTFWRQVFPIYAHYRFYQLLNRDLKILSEEYADKKYTELHEMYTERVRNITFSMRGFYLKQAQLMSTQDDFVPPAYMRWIKDTQDKVPSEFQGSEAREYCAKLLREELGLEFDDIFSNWDDIPLGVASIGQVHAATLKSTGEKVAVKLLVPNIEKKFRVDIRTLKSFCQLAMPQHVSAFEEIERQFTTGKRSYNNYTYFIQIRNNLYLFILYL
jgi:aarF domain-containing kinase